MTLFRHSRRTFLQTAMTGAPGLALLPTLGAQSNPSQTPATAAGREMSAEVLTIGALPSTPL